MATAADAAHNFCVKRTFIDVVEAPPSPRGGAGMRRRCCSDPALLEAERGRPERGSPRSEEGSVEFELCGFSDTETLDGQQDSDLPCYKHVARAAAPPAAAPAGSGRGDGSRPATEAEASAGADAAAGPAAEPVEQKASAADLLASENARLQLENQLLRERCAVVEEQWGASAQQLTQQPTQWGAAWIQMPAGFVSVQGIPFCVAQLPADDALAAGFPGGGHDRGARPRAQRRPQEEQRQTQKQRGGRAAEGQKPAPFQPEQQEGFPTRTTVMLRNLPNNYTRAMLLSMLDNEGFSKQYDFAYLPIDFKTRACLGYAFINLVDAAIVPRFWRRFDGYSNWILPSRKLCHISWSEPHQGLEMHLDRYRNSPIMHATVPDEHKPVLFQDGVRVPFPEPTKATRAPRPRPSMAPKEHPARQAAHAAGGPARGAGGPPGSRGAGARGGAPLRGGGGRR